MQGLEFGVLALGLLEGSWYFVTNYNCTYNCTYNHIRAVRGAYKYSYKYSYTWLVSTMNLQVGVRGSGM